MRLCRGHPAPRSYTSTFSLATSPPRPPNTTTASKDAAGVRKFRPYLSRDLRPVPNTLGLVQKGHEDACVFDTPLNTAGTVTLTLKSHPNLVVVPKHREFESDGAVSWLPLGIANIHASLALRVVYDSDQHTLTPSNDTQNSHLRGSVFWCREPKVCCRAKSQNTLANN